MYEAAVLPGTISFLWTRQNVNQTGGKSNKDK